MYDWVFPNMWPFPILLLPHANEIQQKERVLPKQRLRILHKRKGFRSVLFYYFVIYFFQSHFFHTISTQLFVESFFQVWRAFAWKPALHSLRFDSRCDFIFIGVKLNCGFFWSHAFTLHWVVVWLLVRWALIFFPLVALWKIRSFSFECVKELEAGGVLTIFFWVDGFP